jgi:hypothetical protein
MTQSAKKKKQSINRELIVGGGAILLMLPIIAFAILGALLGVFMGFALLSFQEVTTITALALFITYAFFTVVFGLLLWRVTKRIMLLLNRKKNLKAEQHRVAHLMDATSAEERLKERDLAPDWEQKSPIEKPIGGHESTF